MKPGLFRGLLLLSIFSAGDAWADAPAPPQNVQPAWIRSWPQNYARVTWSLSPEATTYNVYRASDATSAWEIIGTGLTDVIFFDTEVATAERSYFVTAVGAEGESAASEVVTTHDNDFVPYFYHNPPDTWYGTLTPTTAVISWWVSLISGADAMLEIGPSLTNLTIVGFRAEYAGGGLFQLTNLNPATSYYYRMTSVGTNRAGTGAVQWFTTPDINHPPSANSFSAGPILNPWPTTFTLTGNDPDPGTLPLEFRIVTSPTNGTLSTVYYYSYYGSRYLDYTPNPGARGEDHFQFVANDGQLDSAPATATLTNIWQNRAPQVVSFSTNTLEDVALPLTLTATDADGDALTIEVYGSLYGSISGTFPNVVYTPEANYTGVSADRIDRWKNVLAAEGGLDAFDQAVMDDLDTLKKHAPAPKTPPAGAAPAAAPPQPSRPIPMTPPQKPAATQAAAQPAQTQPAQPAPQPAPTPQTPRQPAPTQPAPQPVAAQPMPVMVPQQPVAAHAPMVAFTCPHCRGVFHVPAALAGRQAQCPGCYQAIIVPQAAPRV